MSHVLQPCDLYLKVETTRTGRARLRDWPSCWAASHATAKEKYGEKGEIQGEKYEEFDLIRFNMDNIKMFFDIF